MNITQTAGFDPHHLAELIRQLLHHHTESLELRKHAGQIVAGESTDVLQT